MDHNAAAAQSNSRKRQRTASEVHAPSAPVNESAFIQDQDAGDSGADDDDDDEGKGKDKKAGRRKIKIEFIQDKSRRHITFSKRKAGIMKKAYELSTLTGTQVLLLVVSETGLVYTFTTAKLQPLVTQPEGKNLIQACLNAPHGQLPSSMPVGTPIGRSAAGSGTAAGAGGSAAGGAGAGNASGAQGGANHPGGLAIGDDDDGGKSSDPEDARATGAMGEKRRRAESGAALRSPPTASGPGASGAGGQAVPGPSPSVQTAQTPQQQQQQQQQQQATAQPPFPQPAYGQHPQDPTSQQAMYPHMMPAANYYGAATGGQHNAMPAHWAQQQAQQYARR